MADARPRHVLHVMATRMDFRSPASFMDRKKNFFFSNPLFKNRPICFAFRRARFLFWKKRERKENEMWNEIEHRTGFIYTSLGSVAREG